MFDVRDEAGEGKRWKRSY